jgi:hypothetical protein
MVEGMSAAGHHQQRRGGTDHAFWSHVNLLCCHSDKGAGREGLVVDIGNLLAFELIEDAYDFFHGIDATSVCIHVQNDQLSMGLHRRFDAAPDYIDER